jgi:5-(carboxyamino)imidazole ribonucleotide mutase
MPKRNRDTAGSFDSAQDDNLECSAKRLAVAQASKTPIVGIIMGSRSDWETMSSARDTLEELEIPCEVRVVSAHRMPDEMFEYAASAASRGLAAIIAGAGGAAHLPGMTAAKTLVPVIGVPVHSLRVGGLDSLLSIAQMPPGVPVATMAIGGAVNAALFAARIVALNDAGVADRLAAYAARMHDAAASSKLD